MARVSTFVKVFAIASALTVLALNSAAIAATYYVSTTGDNSRLGTSPDTAWRTIAYAASIARAGDAVYVKGGNYGNENVVLSYSGNSTSPIVFEGYDGTPVLDQGGRSSTSTYGILMSYQSYITIRNFEVIGYYNCVYLRGDSYITLENINCHDCGWDSYKGYGICVADSNHITLRNCKVTDCGGANIQLSGSDDCLLDACEAYGTLVSTDTYATDYYIILAYSSRNIVRNCIAEDKAKSQKGNHGIGIKDGGSSWHEHSTGNQFIGCKGYALEECIFAAHGAHHNTYTNCIGDSSQKNYYFNNGLMVRDGAHENLFVNCTAIGSPGALCIYDNEAQNFVLDSKIQYGNTFRNCTFIARGTYIPSFCIHMRNAQNNLFDTCSFVNAPALIWFSKDNDGTERNSGNTFLNCTVYNLGALASLTNQWYPFSYTASYTMGYDDMADISFQFCNFWQNGFGTPVGTGNTSVEPHFVDPAHDDYRLQIALAWVDFAFTGTEAGTEAEPFKTLDTGFLWVIPGGTVRIKAGTSSQAVRVDKPMRIEASGGTATIGRN